MHKLLIVMKRKPGMSVADFRDYYENRHVPLCMPLMGAAAKRYVRRYLEPSAAGEPPFDVITELWFDSQAAVDATLAMFATGATPDFIAADEEQFLDRSATRAYAVSECETAL
jgi:uncharacterized protein (TIGR02118 family)